MSSKGAAAGFKQEEVPFTPIPLLGYHDNGVPKFGTVIAPTGKEEVVLICEGTGRPMPSQLRKLGLMKPAVSGPNYRRNKEADAVAASSGAAAASRAAAASSAAAKRPLRSPPGGPTR